MSYWDWQLNPIPPHQRNRLYKWLLKEVARYEREEDYPYFVSLVAEIADVDPSPTGKYSQWILKQLIANRLHAPDDFEKVHIALSTFQRIARRLPPEYRNIQNYQNYSELFRVIEEFLPKTFSKKELREKGTHLISQVGPYKMYELTTPEAVVAASKNTGWCTCNYDTAKEYLNKANLYIFYKDDEKFLLAHPGSQEVMLTDNSPYTEDDPQLISIFAEHLPNMYCSEHQSFRNKRCYSCNQSGCCGYIQCGHEGCPEWICGSNPECGARCKSCEVWFCHDHVVDECHECGEYLCGECYEECPNCRHTMCVDHQTACDICEEISCDECIEKCYECGLNYDHSCRFECSGCNQEKCINCAEKTGENETECSVCGYHFCQDCIHVCNECGKIACNWCVDDEGVCNNCNEPGDEQYRA